MADERAWSLPEAVRDRLRIAVDNAGGPAMVSRATGIGGSTLSKILTGTGDVGFSRIAAIAAEAAVELDWLLTGAGRSPAANDEPETTAVPFVGDLVASAGGGALPPDFEVLEGSFPLPTQWLRHRFGDLARLRMLPVSGGSMSPILEDGDIILFKLVEGGIGDGLYVIALGGAVMVKRLQVQAKRTRVFSAAPGYDSVDVSGDERSDPTVFRVIGKVVYSFRPVS